MTAYLASIIPDFQDDQPDGSDSWKASVRMIYLVTIEVNDPSTLDATREYSFHVANFHNAEAIKAAFRGVSTVTVTFEPDVLEYLRRFRGRA